MAEYISSFTGAQIDAAITKANELPSTSVSAAQDGTTLSLVTTGEKYLWNNAGGGTLDYDTTTSDIENIDSTIISQALRKTAQALSAAEKTQALTNLGIPNARNITISTSEPTSSDGSDGDIWLVYEA